VPAGTTKGCGWGSGAAGAGADVAGELIAFPPAAFDGAAVSWLVDAVSAGFFEQATSVNIRKMDNKYSARERMIFPPEQSV